MIDCYKICDETYLHLFGVLDTFKILIIFQYLQFRKLKKLQLLTTKIVVSFTYDPCTNTQRTRHHRHCYPPISISFVSSIRSFLAFFRAAPLGFFKTFFFSTISGGGGGGRVLFKCSLKAANGSDWYMGCDKTADNCFISFSLHQKNKIKNMYFLAYACYLEPNDNSGIHTKTRFYEHSITIHVKIVFNEC